MDVLEDSWWPSTITQSRPFTLPRSSLWVQRQDGHLLTIQVGGDPAEYQTTPDCLPFLMLLDMVQMTYLQMSNSSSIEQQEIFYKGVVFLDGLRRDFLTIIQKASPYSETQRALVPESMKRWLCRLLQGIPHDPLNRKRHAKALNKAYSEIDVCKYDFLNWSLINEKDLVSCLSAASDLAMTSLYPAEPQRWLRTLRSQFIQVGLSTPSSQSESKIREQQMNPHKQLREQERINPTVEPALSPSLNHGSSGSNTTSHLDQPDLNIFQLPASPVQRGRGRPRRKAAIVPLEEPTVGPIRRLRSRQNAITAISQDSWTKLSNAPPLTPVSPKKNRQARNVQRGPQPSGSTSGPIVKSAVKTQVQPEFVPSNNKVRNRLPHLAPFGTKSHSTRGRSLETHVPLKKAEVNQTSDTTKISACAEHFRYIANMSSFSDSRFKDIAKDILKNPEDSWKAFISLSKDSRNASAKHWETLMIEFNARNGSKKEVKEKAISDINKIYMKWKKI